MPIAVKLLDDQIKKVSDTNTLLDMLLEFEKTLDDLDLYAYKNWSKGEVLEGPTLDRHYVNVKLMYKESDMPDPEGAKRLFARDCLVKYTKDDLISPVKVKTFDDVTTDMRSDGSMRHKAKTITEPVWIVDIKMPRRYVDEFSTEIVQADEETYVDTDSMNAENEIQAEVQTTGGEV